MPPGPDPTDPPDEDDERICLGCGHTFLADELSEHGECRDCERDERDRAAALAAEMSCWRQGRL